MLSRRISYATQPELSDLQTSLAASIFIKKKPQQPTAPGLNRVCSLGQVPMQFLRSFTLRKNKTKKLLTRR